MKICFYTNSNPSISNLLNISHLIQNRPKHEYCFLVVKNTIPSSSIVQKLKNTYARWRFNDGRFDYEDDNAKIRQELASYIQPYKKNLYPHKEVEAVNDDASITILKEWQPDIIMQAGAGILKKEVFEQAKVATINVHHGIAPEIRGIESTFWALFYGLKDHIGVTCHLIDENLDTGAIIKREFLKTNATNYIEIQKQNYLLGRDVLLQSIDFLNEHPNYTTTTDGDVKSYYFGVVNPFLYYALKKKHCEPLMKISQKACKMKAKRFTKPG